jgi:ElaB/YqjD/DUF883 family membrane-anchored ribosome-binding protein
MRAMGTALVSGEASPPVVHTGPTGGTMGIFDNIKNKASGLVEKAEDMASDLGNKAGDMAGKAKDQASDGMQQAGDMIDEKTGGRFSDQINSGEQAAQQMGIVNQPAQDGFGQQQN